MSVLALSVGRPRIVCRSSSVCPCSHCLSVVLWNNGEILATITEHASDWVLTEIRGPRTLQRLARITTTEAGTSARGFAKLCDAKRLTHLADTHMVSGV